MWHISKSVCLVSIVACSLLLAMACGGASPATTSPASKPAGVPSSSTPSGPAAGGLTLDVTPILDGQAPGPAKVTVTTAPGATCTIKVVNPKTGTVSSYPTEKTKVADASGKVVWEWNIPKHVAKGDGTIEVTATKDGQTVTKTVVYRIVVSDY